MDTRQTNNNLNVAGKLELLKHATEITVAAAGAGKLSPDALVDLLEKSFQKMVQIVAKDIPVK